MISQATLFKVLDYVLYFVDSKQPSGSRIVAPKHLREKITEEYHTGAMGGHFSGARMYKTLMSRWWWSGMYSDCMNHCKSCPQCAIVTGGY